MSSPEAVNFERSTGHGPCFSQRSTSASIYAATYAFWLSRIFNPPGDLVRYAAAVVLIVGGVVMALFARFA